MQAELIQTAHEPIQIHRASKHTASCLLPDLDQAGADELSRRIQSERLPVALYTIDDYGVYGMMALGPDAQAVLSNALSTLGVEIVQAEPEPLAA